MEGERGRERAMGGRRMEKEGKEMKSVSFKLTAEKLYHFGPTTINLPEKHLHLTTYTHIDTSIRTCVKLSSSLLS